MHFNNRQKSIPFLKHNACHTPRHSDSILTGTNVRGVCYIQSSNMVRDGSKPLATPVAFADLRGFYTNQRPSWVKLCDAVNELKQNSTQLEAHEEAGQALARMKEILTAASPYKLLQEVSGVIHTTQNVNNRLVSDMRGPVSGGIQGLIDNISSELDAVSADDELRQKATQQLKMLLESAGQDTSFAHLSQATQRAETAFDNAMQSIENAQTPPSDSPTGSTPSAPKVKKRRLVEAKALWSGAYIETAEDVEAFLIQMRAELEAAIEADKRVKIK